MSLPATGYLPPRLAELRTEMQVALRTAFGANVNLDPAGTILGRLLDIYAARLDELSEATGDLYNSFDEREAEGQYLDNLFGLIGLLRLQASKSLVTVTLSGVAGTAVPSGAFLRDVSGADWRTVAAATIGGGGTVDVQARAAEEGPTAAGPGEITIIVTPYVGWTGVTNAAAAIPGRLLETDAEYRLRKARSMMVLGSANAAAIRARLEALGLQARVVENRTHLDVVIDGRLLTPHSFLAVIYPGGGATVADIATVIWRHGSAGIRACGNQTATATDAAGVMQTVRWGIAAATPYDITVTRLPVDGAQVLTIEATVQTYFDSLSIGEEPRSGPLGCLILHALPELTECVVTYAGGPIGELHVATVGNVIPA